jgi:hypothetical protein
MPAVTLLIRAIEGSHLETIKKLLKSELEGLRVDLEVQGLAPGGWVRVAVSGEDERMALNYLTREFGQCPERLDSVGRLSTIRGRLAGLERSEDEVRVDIGVLEPRVEASVSLFRLQGQLADGRKVALGKLVELFGLCENLPLTVKVLSIDVSEGRVDCMLADGQVSRFRAWTRSLLDRLIVIGADVQEAQSAVRRAGFGRDVVGVERLGFFECAAVCKLGTDGVGLIPRVGRQLRHAAFSVFSPRRVLGFFQDDPDFLVS